MLLREFRSDWKDATGEFQTRCYDSYERYLEHQKSKLETHEFGNYDTEFRAALRNRLVALDLDWSGRSVLCLGARIGTEVKAFLDLGCFAIGVDLNPGPQNPYVVQGDFHDLKFAPKSIDLVYTNSLDHAFDLDRIAKEVLKVLKHNGLFIVEAVHGTDQGINPGFFESFFWKDVNGLIGLFEKAGFTVVCRNPIEFPWPGEALLFKTRRNAA